MRSSVHEAKKLNWDFGDKPPHYSLKVRTGAWGERVEVDPFPCYAHSKTLVEESLEKTVGRSWDLGVKVYIGHHEPLERSNAWASEAHRYGARKKNGDYDYHRFPYIFLAGKRIPPHPAVTRYLIPHEYGHCVDYWLGRKLGLDEHGRSSLREQYREFRGLPKVDHYGGGTWHKIAAEVLACDFRILVCEAEPEYWPHKGIEYPTPGSPWGQWWKHLLTKDEDEWQAPKDF